jgi:singapore isolate B (sub-type 7) whole genome shotgun sequence assembly, scaffold_7
MLLISLAKLFLPLYLLLCPVNLLRSFGEVAVPRSFAWKVVAWVAVQVGEGDG